jgi:sugar phosphate isomerase/epimerase
MLKYSFMTFACPEYTLDEVIGAAVRYGYDGIEPRATENHRHSIELDRTPAERAQIRRKCTDAGIAMGCIATSVQLNRPEPAQRREMVEKTKAYCQLAADLGAGRIRVFGGHAADNPDRETAAARVLEGLNACEEAARNHGVFVCLETHDFFCAGSSVAGICRKIDSPWIRATWDTQHPVTAGEDIAFTESVLMPFVQHVHFHDVDRTEGRNDCVPIGQGQAPIAQLLSIFRKHNYAGYISAEWFYNNGPENDLAHYIARLREIEKTI